MLEALTLIFVMPFTLLAALSKGFVFVLAVIAALCALGAAHLYKKGWHTAISGTAAVVFALGTIYYGYTAVTFPVPDPVEVADDVGDATGNSVDP